MAWTGYTSKQNLVFTTSGGRLVPFSKIFQTHPKPFVFEGFEYLKKSGLLKEVPWPQKSIFH